MARRLRRPRPRRAPIWAAACAVTLGLVLVASSCSSRVAGRGGPSINANLGGARATSGNAPAAELLSEREGEFAPGARFLSDRDLAANTGREDTTGNQGGTSTTGTGGGRGSAGSSIWTWVWWLGNPQGPGPYIGPSAGGAGVCLWHDVGHPLRALNDALANAGLPASFWDSPQSSAHPGIWAVDLWGAHLLAHARAWDHFDLVACPELNQVPPMGGGVESGFPPAKTPSGKVMHLWIFWDTVPDPPVFDLPPLIHAALARARLPAPVISTSPASIDEFADSTIVNFPTWLWIDASAWRMVRATADGGGLVATVWATPISVTWRAEWNFPHSRDDPEGGVTIVPEVVDLVCGGPGQPYDETVAASAQSSACEAMFTQSTFGTYQSLEASITWQIHWALSDFTGVVGGEGLFGGSVTSGRRPLRVLQVESIITQG